MMKGESQKAKVEILFVQTVNFAFPRFAARGACRPHFFTALAVCLFTIAFGFLSFEARAQQQQQQEQQQEQDEQPADMVPPPLKKLSNEEKERLEAEQNVKKRTQLAIDLMEARLKTAATQKDESDYRGALDTLGGFQALLENTLDFLTKNDVRSGRVQNNFKRFELALRAQAPRLELIRRELPLNYGYHVQKLIRAVRDARAKAVEPLFSNTVVPERKP